ncbi:MAG: hypothetical protein K940chlam8_00912, partial [Chlamydiae bacterium]|nr:hypothetical protein [Chlamydiota bacterium]
PGVGQKLLDLYPDYRIFCFHGDLGAGKTTLIKEIISKKDNVKKDVIVSPTFVYCNLYETCAHFDLYRLKNPQEFTFMGFDELFDTHLCLIEWPERLVELPQKRIDVFIEHETQNTRRIMYEKST